MSSLDFYSSRVIFFSPLSLFLFYITLRNIIGLPHRTLCHHYCIDVEFIDYL